MASALYRQSDRDLNQSTMAGTQALFRLDGSGPLYKQIKGVIARPILSGRLSPGARLPSEHEFMALFSTSRMTVNKALQSLAEDGLVVRRRPKGTFVAPQVTEHAVMDIVDIIDEVEAAGGRYGYRLLARAVETRPKLPLAPGAELLHLVCRHDSDGIPVLLEDRWINVAAVPSCLEESFGATPPTRWLLRNVPWTNAEHTIRAIPADRPTARELEISEGEACLQVERTTWQAHMPITLVTLTYPGDRHQLVARFAPGRGVQ